MNQSRILQLQQAVQAREDQPFPFYALAIEYKLVGDFENSRRFFEETLRRFPNYVPTFYHYGQLLEAISEPEEARRMYQMGVQVASEAGDAHAHSELLGALRNLE
jgi:tetratricopeptide (TPR) repeat protein